VRIVLKGIHKVKKRLASCDTRIHFYAWRGGPPIHAKPGTPEFVHAFNEAHASIRRPTAGTLMTVIADYKASPDFTKLAPSSRRMYLMYIRMIEEAFGDMPLAALADRRVRGEFKAWRDTFAATPRKADYAWTTLARLMSFAKDRGTIATNPCEKGGRLYVADRTEKFWGEREIAALLAVASPQLKLALVLALWTGQRQGDLLRLPWSAYDGSHIRLRQSKTGRRIVMPAGFPLKALLDAAERAGPLILVNTYGRPWTDLFDGLTFHVFVQMAVSGRCDRTAVAEQTANQRQARSAADKRAGERVPKIVNSLCRSGITPDR
jgi:integrase